MKKTLIMIIVSVLMIGLSGCNTKMSLYNTGLIKFQKLQVQVFRTDRPDVIVETKNVDQISLELSDTYKEIPINKLSARWVGEVVVNNDIKRLMNVSQSMAKVVVRINDVVVKDNIAIFNKGVNRVEVEYTSNWHNAKFRLNFTNSPSVKDKSKTAETLRKLIDENTRLEYVGVHKSGNSNNQVRLNVTGKEGSVILFLSSHDAVSWIIENTNKVDIKAIIYNSEQKGSSVDVLSPSEVSIFNWTDLKTAYRNTPSVAKVGGKYRFENTEFRDVRKLIKDTARRELHGYAGVYSATDVTVPETILDKNKYREIDETFANMDSLISEDKNFNEAKQMQKVFQEVDKAEDNDIPENMYKVYYLNTNKSDTIAETAIVDKIGLEAYYKFNGIDADNLSAKWVGYINSNTAKEVTPIITNVWPKVKIRVEKKDMEADIQNIWSNVKIKVNGEDMRNNRCKFIQGSNKVEVYYINNWHHTRFSVDFQNDIVNNITPAVN